jgi:hypothetical protein
LSDRDDFQKKIHSSVDRDDNVKINGQNNRSVIEVDDEEEAKECPSFSA